jgi:hypothetical protein
VSSLLASAPIRFITPFPAGEHGDVLFRRGGDHASGPWLSSTQGCEHYHLHDGRLASLILPARLLVLTVDRHQLLRQDEPRAAERHDAGLDGAQLAEHAGAHLDGERKPNGRGEKSNPPDVS